MPLKDLIWIYSNTLLERLLLCMDWSWFQNLKRFNTTIRKNLNTIFSHLDQKGVLQASQVMVQQLVEKGMLKDSIPKLDNFNGDSQTTKHSFHVWEKQVMALEGDYTPASIRTAIRNSLKGRALQDITILPPDASWKVLLDTLRIKYQHKASYDSMLSVFYGLQMTPAEDCAVFSSKSEQKVSYVQPIYPDELNTKQYWYLLRERFFHGFPVNLRTNIRSEYEKE